MIALQGEVRRRVEPSGVQPLPMAIAVLAMVETVSEDVRRSARLDLALHAYKLGYFVVDVLEVRSDADADAYGWVEELAEQTDADALVCSGPLDRGRLEAVADRSHMTIRVAPAPAL